MHTADEVRALLDYEPSTGVFRWRESRPGCRAGEIAGTFNAKGYWLIMLQGKRYYAHRLAWVHAHGRWPDGEIDHINMDQSDNRLINLRDASKSQNMANTGKRSDNSVGLKGVSYHRGMGKYQANLQVRGRSIYLGYHETADDAHAAYCEAVRRLQGEFARTE